MVKQSKANDILVIFTGTGIDIVLYRVKKAVHASALNIIYALSLIN